jgi:hypothetical protein
VIPSVNVMRNSPLLDQPTKILLNGHTKSADILVVIVIS